MNRIQILTLTFCLTATSGLAQSTSTTPARPATPARPSASAPNAQAQQDALARQWRELRIKTLEAYTAALKAGKSERDARAEALRATGADRQRLRAQVRGLRAAQPRFERRPTLPRGFFQRPGDARRFFERGFPNGPRGDRFFRFEFRRR